MEDNESNKKTFTGRNLDLCWVGEVYHVRNTPCSERGGRKETDDEGIYGRKAQGWPRDPSALLHALYMYRLNIEIITSNDTSNFVSRYRIKIIALRSENPVQWEDMKIVRVPLGPSGALWINLNTD